MVHAGGIIAVANQKGGVAKTQSVVNLAAALADRGQRVLVVDVDPQSSASAALGFDLTGQYTSLYHLMSRTRTQRPVPTEQALWRPEPNLALLPSHIDLAALEVELLQTYNRERVLADVLAPVAPLYDVVLLDCPPSLGWLTVNALSAADAVLVPVIPDYVSALGLNTFRQTLETVQTQLNTRLSIAGVFLTRVRASTTAHKTARADIAAFCAEWGVPLLPIEIPDTIRAAEAVAAGVPLVRYEPSNPASRAYQALASKILEVPSHA